MLMNVLQYHMLVITTVTMYLEVTPVLASRVSLKSAETHVSSDNARSLEYASYMVV